MQTSERFTYPSWHVQTPVAKFIWASTQELQKVVVEEQVAQGEVQSEQTDVPFKTYPELQEQTPDETVIWVSAQVKQ